MKNERDPSTGKYSPSGTPFLQPLALAGVCLVFVVLLLIMGVMDFRSLDKTFTAYIEKQGVDFIHTVESAAGNNLQQINSSPEWDLGAAVSTGVENQRLSLQDTMVMAILRLARRIDHDVENGILTGAALLQLPSSEGVWNLVLFDDQGIPTFEKRPISKTVQKAVLTMIKDHKDLLIRILEPVENQSALRFLALRRNNGGFLALVFDEKSFFSWKLQMAVEMAVETVGLLSNTECFLIANDSGVTLFETGSCSKPSAETGLVSSIVKKRNGVSSKRVVSNGRKQLMMVERFSPVKAVSFSAYLWLNTEDLDRIIEREKRWGLLAMGLMVFLAVLSMWFLYRNQNRHIARMQQMARRLQQAERLSSMGRLAAGVAHEIRNPLNAISMACQRLKEDNMDHLSSVIRHEVRRLNGIIEEFLGLSKGQRLKLEKVALSDLVRKVAMLMGEESRSKGIEIQTGGTESGPMVMMDGNKITQALINMVKNAVESIQGPGIVKLETGANEAGMAFIRITDTGSGVDDVDMIFNLDFTTKEKGLGLGLTLAYEIVQAHGGRIQVESKLGVGTSFLILLPVKVDAK
jgi:signal transduction histidine kinase